MTTNAASPISSTAEWCRRFDVAWLGIGADPAPAVRDGLVAMYSQKRRHYHNLAHLVECLAVFDLLAHRCLWPHEVEVALGFHDAWCDTDRNDNEKRSAEFAFSSLIDAGVEVRRAERVADIVRATDHRSAPPSIDAEVALDCDLWILGASPERFDIYEEEVRREYAHIDETQYLRGRRRVMRLFAQRQIQGRHLYRLSESRERFEAAASANIARSLQRIDAGLAMHRLLSSF